MTTAQTDQTDSSRWTDFRAHGRQEHRSPPLQTPPSGVFRRALVGFALIAGFIPPVCADDRPPLPAPQRSGADALSREFERAAESIRPSVVSIRSERRIRSRQSVPELPGDEFRRFFGDDLFDRFFSERFPQRSYLQRGIGTGIIVSAEGYIVTNSHVVHGADKLLRESVGRYTFLKVPE